MLPARLRRGVRAAASDVTPLRQSAPFRRLFAGQAVSMVGTQVTQVAVPLQVYALTRSSLAVGLVGVTALAPLVLFGLYGGAIADAVDRRRLVLLTSTGAMLVSLVLLAQALLRVDRVGVLFACVAVQAAFAAVDSPTRRAIIPQLLPAGQLPAANTLVYGSSQLALIVAPLLAGVAVGTGGFPWAYGIDVASFAGAFYAAARLRFLARRPVVLSTFLADGVAMVFGSPRALFPALAYGHFGGGARTAGLLYAAPAAGAVATTLLGGAVARVRRQGLGVAAAIVAWGLAICLFGLAPTLWLGLLALAAAGAADTVSAVYRSTILQVETPPGLQGRLQGVFIVVVTGGPRLGDLESGAVAAAFGPQVAVVSGGLACLAGIGLLALAVPAFVRYDVRAAAASQAVAG
jgi:MFS family permease